MIKKYELKPADLRCECNPEIFHFKDTSELDPLDEVIGQERAVQAIDFGLHMQSPGYNIFVTGEEGTGKSTIVNDLVREYAATLPTPVDWCMVNNFRDEHRTRAIRVPPGRSTVLCRRIDALISALRKRLPEAFEDESYLKKKSALDDAYAQKRETLLGQLEKMAAAKSIQISRSASGFVPVPVKDGQPFSKEVFMGLPDPERSRIEENIGKVQAELEVTAKEIGKLKQVLQTDTEKLMAEVASFVVKNRIALIHEEYEGWPDVIGYLKDLELEIVENVANFLTSQEEKTTGDDKPAFPWQTGFQRYRVNVLVDRKTTEGAPVIFEPNPTYQNLFGRIEKRAYMGAVMTDFTMVQAGSLLQADGGFLILEMESVLSNPYVWEGLKRTLLNKRLSIEDVSPGSLYGPAALRPEPVPLDVRVILLGSYELFHQ